MIRLDRLDLSPNGTTKFEKTPEGYLTGVAAICSTGVYQYMNQDGTVHGELRLPEEVFSQEFLNSLRMKPLTLMHPDQAVTAENVRDYQVGTLGEYSMNPDNYHVLMGVTVHDAGAVQAILNGTQELSVGYSCDVIDEAGVFCGVPYQKIQRNLRANHVSIVPAARGGDTLKIRLDSADSAVLVKDQKKEATMAELKTVKLDGVDFQAEAQVIQALNAAVSRADTLQASLTALGTEKSTLEASRDTLQDKCDALEGQVKALEASRIDEGAIQAAVARRVRILDAAKRAKVEVKADMSEVDIQKAVILSQSPNAKLDDKDAVYIDSRFDGAIDTMDLRNDAESRQLNASDDPENSGNHTDGTDPVAEARARYLASLNKKGA